MKTYKSEKRNIIEETINGEKTYFVEFVITTITERLFGNPTSSTETILDAIPFKTIEDAQLYCEYAEKPSKVNSKINDISYAKAYPVRLYMFLKNNDIIKAKYDKLPEYCEEYVSENKPHKKVFGLFGTNDYDKSTFKEFLKTVCPERKVIKTFSVYDLENIENDEEMEKLYAERNGIIEQEIYRLRENIKFLEKLRK